MATIKKPKSPFLKFLEKRNIQYVGFDIDNTLIPTNMYYRENIFNVVSKIHKYLKSKKDVQTMYEEYSKIFIDRYLNRGKAPMSITNEVEESFEEYLGYMNEDIQDMINKNFADFYKNSASPYNSAYEILRILKEANIKFVLCSHAEDDWTNVKVNLLGKELDMDIPYLAVGISSVKDANSWKKSIAMINGNIEESLIIGDSFEADILSAIEAGSKNVIWIDISGVGIPKNASLPDSVNFRVVHTLENILKIEA
jgi:FMN phosphatase YigB (HAD superfamily)